MVNFIVFLILHFIGDFYLQTTRMAKCKNAQIGLECNNCKKCKTGAILNIKYMLLHTILYIIPFFRLFFMICVNTENGIKYRIVIGLVRRKVAYCP